MHGHALLHPGVGVQLREQEASDVPPGDLATDSPWHGVALMGQEVLLCGEETGMMGPLR